MTNTIRRRAKAALAALLIGGAGPAAALDLSLPSGARMTHEDTTDPGSYRLPIGNWTLETGLPVRRVEGRVTRQAWRIPGQSATTLQLMTPLREQIEAAGYTILHQCPSQTCGGFDFRFDTEVLQGPDMYVDLADFRFLAAVQQTNGGDALGLIVSRSASAGYVQIIRAGAAFTKLSTSAPEAPPPLAPLPLAPLPLAPLPIELGGLADRLDSAGHVVLPDLRFDSGKAGLGADDIESLDTLAAYLAARPNARLVIVGHTDATGSLEGNIALSRRRAQAAVDYLTGHGVARTRLSAQGAGYLSPITTNTTEDGRMANRRIEAVLLPDP
ncbi:OmpA family protein [Puniceibacterium sp. IMCC21224]|uniref:OmpA family protein n=1 Tax=Puniceibacterium sp. IMCC21224 TaxID=1618204 RepID=UPI00064DD26D|nr:OmpA family protein [Puniceibacterium sp. IMCC21224]KMK65346.1 outer membrane protein/peptidoglycan-associated (lipo)protein [Puniceibacterium sp. IMCC21224]